MKKIIALIFILFTTNIIISQNIWVPMNNPENGFVSAFLKLPDGTILAGTNGGVYRSSDEGISWSQSGDSLYGVNVTSFTFTNNSNIWAGTFHGVFLSTDNGLNWKKKLDGITYSIASNLAGDLFAGLYGAVARSMDNGQTWEQFWYGLPPKEYNAIGITSNGNIYAGNAQGNIIYSPDNCATWIYRPSATGVNALSINALDEIFIGTEYAFQKSSDYGSSWITMEHGLPDYPEKEMCALLATENGVWAGLNTGGIYFLSNSTNTWTPKNNGISLPVKIRSFLKLSESVFLAGSNYGVYISTDAGSNWEISNSGLKSIHFNEIATTKSTNIFGLFDGGVYVSSDAGINWNMKKHNLTSNMSLNLAVDIDNRIYISSYWAGNNLLLSTDFGDSWIDLTDGTQEIQGIKDIFIAPESNIVFVCSHSGVFKSTDFGNTWQLIYNNSTITMNIHPNGDLYICSSNILRSKDDGITWEQVYNGNLAKNIGFTKDGTAIIESGRKLFYSPDDCLTWIPFNDGLPSSPNVSDLLVTDNDEIVISTTTDGIFYNSEFNQPWVSANTGLQNKSVSSISKFGDEVLAATKGTGLFKTLQDNLPVELNSFSIQKNNQSVKLSWVTSSEINNLGFEIMCNDQLIGFVEGNGTKTVKSEYLFIDQPLTIGEKKYDLVQIDYDGTKEKIATKSVYFEKISMDFKIFDSYPNPFNPSTNISYSIPNSGLVELKVYDLLGREISTLVNEIQEAGIHNIVFNAAELNSAVYIVQIRSGKFYGTKKIMLIK